MSSRFGEHISRSEKITGLSRTVLVNLELTVYAQVVTNSVFLLLASLLLINHFFRKRESKKACNPVKSKLQCKQYNAISDIESGSPRLIVKGGIAPLANTKKDYLFEKRYGIKYHISGCEAEPFPCIQDYNLVIFDYLDKTYGKSWRIDVRKDELFLQGKKP